jgi:hypothetical protein
LGNITGVLINYVEFALDWTFRYKRERNAAWRLVNRHIVKRWRRASQGIRYVKRVTRYTAGRHATSNLVGYADQPSRITGELYCVHIEFRVNRVRSLQRVGISSANDLIDFDHYRFWKPRLLMRAIDLERFGRAYNRQVLGKGPRYGPWIDRITDRTTYNYDIRTAYTVLRLGQYGRSIQAVMDRSRQDLDVNDCLVEIEVGHLLPELTADTAATAKNNSATGHGFRGGRRHLSPYIIGVHSVPTPSGSRFDPEEEASYAHIS